MVTGIGMCTPLGFGYNHCWEQLISSKSGIRKLSGFDIDDLKSKVGGQLILEGDSSLFPEQVIDQKDRKKIFGLRLTRKFFGHLAIESAMASAYQEVNKDSKIITSFKPGKGIDNKYLNSSHSLTFNLTNDYLLILLNFFF